jgi:hypothetical protein
MSKRIFIYSETQLSDENILKLKTEGNRLGHECNSGHRSTQRGDHNSKSL